MKSYFSYLTPYVIRSPASLKVGYRYHTRTVRVLVLYINLSPPGDQAPSTLQARIIDHRRSSIPVESYGTFRDDPSPPSQFQPSPTMEPGQSRD